MDKQINSMQQLNEMERAQVGASLACPFLGESFFAGIPLSVGSKRKRQKDSNM